MCGAVVAVKRDGTMQGHGWRDVTRSIDTWCQGSGEKGWALPKPQISSS